MGLNLSPLKRIGSDLINPVINAGKDIGDIGSQVAADVTDNPVAQAHATAAFNANPVSRFVGTNVVKPLAQAPIDIGTQIYNNTVAPAANLPIYTSPQQVPGFLGGISREVGATGSLHQTIGSGIQAGLTLASGGVGDAIDGLAGRAISDTVPEALAKIAPKIASNAVEAGGFNAASAASQDKTPLQIAEAGGEGAAFGAAIPTVPAVTKALPGVVKNLSFDLPEVNDNVVDKAPVDTPKAAVSLKTAGAEAAQAAPQADATDTTATPSPAPAGTPAGAPVVRSIPEANTGLPGVDKAINDVATTYSTPVGHTGNIDAVLEQTRNQERLGKRVSSQLGAVLKKNLTPEENQAVEDFLDGNPTDHLTAKAMKVANALRPLREQGFDVRQAVKSDVGKVVDYSPRIADQTIKGSVARGVQKLQTIGQKLDTSSRYSEARTNDKFIGSGGPKKALIGNPKQLGLTDQGNGVFKDANGKVFKQAHATKDELEQAGLGPYARNTSTVNRVYHGDTLSLKARSEAINSLATDPAGHGLYTKEQVENGVAPQGVQPVVGVTGLEDFYAVPKDASRIQKSLGFNGSATPALLRGYDALSNVATQAIVLNPFFHGMNQLFQTAIAAGNLPGLKGLPGHGMGDVLVALTNLTEDDYRNVIKAGAGGSNYGSDMENLLSKMTGGATKINSKAMAAIEIRLRAALYKASIEKGMTSQEAADNINKFLGDTKHINETVRRATLFAHYFKTMAGAMKEQVTHPIEQRGSIVNAATMAAMTAAVSYGYQKATSNPNANVRLPGELGLLKEGVESAKDAVEGNSLGAASVVTNRINPILKEGAQQLFNKDLYTGQPVTASPGGRLGHLASSTLAPIATGSKVTEGSRSIPELVANQFGLNTPHAKGYQAAPNLPFLNTPKSITSKTGDPTGYQQEQQHFSALSAAQNQANKAGAKTAAQFADYLAHSEDPVTGATIQNSPAETIQNSSALATNPVLLKLVQQYGKSQASHDPIWDLSASQLKTFEQYKAMYTGSAEKTNILQSNPWITKIEAKENTYYNNLPKVPGEKSEEANSQTPTYPVFNKQTTALLAVYDNASAAERTTLLENNAEPLSTAFNDIANWTNAMRKAEGAPPLAGYPQASPQVQSILNTYDALPKGNGPDGGSPNRDAWINANPGAYAQMQNYLTQSSVYNLIKNASEAQFAGTSPDQELLKDIKNVGQYDVAETTSTPTAANPSGDIYSLNPALAYSQGYSSTGDSSSSDAAYSAEVKQSSQNRDAEHAAKAAKYGPGKNYAHPGKVKIKGVPGVKTYKIKGASIGRKYKVSIPKVGKGLSSKSDTSTAGRKVALKA